MIAQLKDTFAEDASETQSPSTGLLPTQEWNHPMAQESDKIIVERQVNSDPSYDIHAEKGVLGCMLAGDEWVSKTASEVISDYFWEPLHKAMFEALVKNNSSDKVRLFTALKESMKVGYHADRVAVLTSECENLIPSPSNLEYYIKPLRECWMKRDLLSVIDKASTMLDKGDSYEDVIAVVDGHLSKQDSEADKGNKTHVEQIRELIDHLEKCQSGERDAMGVPTGISDLDWLTRGIHSGDLFIVAARPGVGKTTLGTNIASHAALEEGKGVLFFSLEMDAKRLQMRIVASVTGIELRLMETKDGLSGPETAKIVRGMTSVQKSGLRIIDSPNMSLHQIRAAARTYCRNQEISLIVVDYLQLVKVPGFRPSERQREVAEISLSLKALARELDVGFLVLSQINRESERMGRKPKMADLRESGAVEQDADCVALLHQPDPEENQVTLILDKNRNGDTGMVSLEFKKAINKFVQVNSFV